ncbi:hypothetical protein HZA26_02580 [Candidatus Nomurabacteria bacterium]|nr:hypothetical protein [Candidatus Nomurabacteria bacterium]
MEKIKIQVYIVVIIVCSFLLAGCMGAEYLVLSAAPSLFQAGAGAVAGLENVDVKTAVSPGVTTNDLHKVKKVAVVLGTESQTQMNPQMPFYMAGGDLTNVMADNIALELMNLGYQVVERTSLDKVLSEQKLQMSGIADPTTAAKIGGILGVDAVVLGNVTTSQKTQVSSGFMGMGSDVTTVQAISNATMKVVGVEQGNVVMIVTLSYKKGQKPTEAAKTMAIALAEKLKNPSGQKGREK